MKTITVLAVVSAIVGSSAYLIKVPTAPEEVNQGPSGYVHLQKLILPLFENVCEVSTDPVILRLSQGFDIDSISAEYSRPEVIQNFKALQTKGLLPKGEIFTNYDPSHVSELKTIYEVLYYARNFDTFLTAAAWARQNVNCGLFINAIYLAVIKRRDTQKLSIPAPYEVLPNYFIQKDVVVAASALLSGAEVTLSDTVRDEGNSYVLDANYTADYIENDYESKLAYFQEDVGLNTFYFLQKLRRSSWFNTTEAGYGEYLYHMMKQLAARYNLERYANDLPEVESINWDTFITVPYDPMLIYSNGNDFGHRTTPLELTSNTTVYNLQLLQTIENNLATVVTHMRDTGYNKTTILNHLMDILVTGEKSFETVLRNYLGKDNTFNSSQPSVLEHYMTSLRDPMFWRLNNKIVEIVDNALKVLPSYTRNDLYFPGVQVLNVDIKKIMTNFDYFEYDVTDALKTGAANTTFQVKIVQPRLNHKPFVVKLNISSLVTQKGIVKIFLGPKVAPGELALKKNLFVLLDNFEWNLKIGANIISRSSEEMKGLSHDFISLRTLRKNVEDAEFGLSSLPLEDIELLTGYPSRLILPKGTPEGLPLQVFVFVAPFVKTGFSGMFYLPSAEYNAAVLTPGYPLDLDMDSSMLFDLPNALVKDVLVTHKGGKGSAKNKEPYDYSSKKYDKTDDFDYSAKKGLYGKKNDFTSKKYEPKVQVDTSMNDNTPKSSDVTVQDVNDKVIKDKSVEKPETDRVIEKEPITTQKSQLVNVVTAKLTSTIRTTENPSVYDYITSNSLHYDEFDPNGDEYPDVKVYY